MDLKQEQCEAEVKVESEIFPVYAITVRRGKRGIAPLMEVSGELHVLAALHPGQHPVPIAQVTVWDPKLVWTHFGENYKP